MKYCSVQCRDDAWNSYHSILCYPDSEDQRSVNLKLFYKLSEKNPARLEIAAQMIAAIISRMKNHHQTLKESIKYYIGQFVTVPFTKISVYKDQWSSGKDNPRDLNPIRFTELLELNLDTKIIPEERQVLFKELLAQPLELLKQVFYEPELEMLFHEEFFDYLLGISVLNSREIRIYSPFHSFLNDIEKSSYSFHFLPFTFKLENIYGGIPRFDVSAICKIYSSINHSCDFNAAIGLSEEMEWSDNSQQYAKSSLYAYKDINPGDEIFVSYISLPEKTSQQRNSELYSHYLFECHCPFCNNNITT